MAIYNKIYEKEKNKLSEDLILQKSLNNYKETLKRIILQKEIKEPFYKIKNINDIINVIKNQKNNINKEIIFIEKELSDLWNKNYIKNILNDLIYFSNNYELLILFEGIINFIEIFNKLKQIKNTQLYNNCKKVYDSLTSYEINREIIKMSDGLLKKYDYDIKNETLFIKFF